MAFDISLLFAPWFILLVVAVVLLVVIVILSSYKSRLKKELFIKKEEEVSLKSKISSLDSLKDKPLVFLNTLDSIAREFFSKKFQLNKDLKYSEYIKFFRVKKYKSAIEFCGKMQEALYSGDNIDKNKLLLIKNKFEYFVKSSLEHNLSEPPKPEVNEDKKEQAPVQNIPIKEDKSLNLEIVKYFREGRKRRFGFNILKGKLLQGGFKEEEINKALDFVISQEDISRSGKAEVETNIRYAPTSLIVESPEQFAKEKEKERVLKEVPYKQEEIKIKKTDYPKKEPEHYKLIENIDNLDRLESKLKEKKSFQYGDKKILP
ncbi:MAG: hypothetical protein AABY05_01300 [Nanoarchaeota archaeon]